MNIWGPIKKLKIASFIILVGTQYGNNFKRIFESL